jgi:hypothetical protein
MFEELERINERPRPFQFYTASDLWTNEHTSKQMLSFHLNEAIDVSGYRGRPLEYWFITGNESDTTESCHEKPA